MKILPLFILVLGLDVSQTKLQVYVPRPNHLQMEGKIFIGYSVIGVSLKELFIQE